MVFFDEDISDDIRFLQSVYDATDTDKTFGGWYNVLKYCESDNLTAAFEYNDFLVIHIDTDCCQEMHYEVARKDEHGRDFTTIELIEKVKQRLEGIMSQYFSENVYETFKHRILFAIAVDEIECWLLSLYATDKRMKLATNNCIHKLNKQLEKKGTKPTSIKTKKVESDEHSLLDSQKIETINPKNKKPRLYEKLSSDFTKNKILMGCYTENPSLECFVLQLQNL